ncbi:MAG: hypothetical protein ACRCZP_03515, partial [Phycicoccus sp.]
MASIEPDALTPVVDGPFEMVVRVSGGGAEDLSLTPQLPRWAWWAPTAATKVVPGGSCPDSCLVSWTIDPAGQAQPWFEGWHRLEVNASTGGEFWTVSGAAVYYRQVVGTTWVDSIAADVTANTTGYASYVVDTGGDVVFEGSVGRKSGEQVTVSILPPADYSAASHDLDIEPLATATGRWSTDPGTGRASGSVH